MGTYHLDMPQPEKNQSIGFHAKVESINCPWTWNIIFPQGFGEKNQGQNAGSFTT